jgi:hypothetical protein
MRTGVRQHMRAVMRVDLADAVVHGGGQTGVPFVTDPVLITVLKSQWVVLPAEWQVYYARVCLVSCT